MRLIDADALPCLVAPYGELLYKIKEAIHNAPTIDAVPVVLCKDCVYYDHLDPGSIFCYLDGRGTKETDYCSWGERKDDETE